MPLAANLEEMRREMLDFDLKVLNIYNYNLYWVYLVYLLTIFLLLSSVSGKSFESLLPLFFLENIKT